MRAEFISRFKTATERIDAMKAAEDEVVGRIGAPAATTSQRGG